MSTPSPEQPCDVCGNTIPEGQVVYTMLDALTGPIVVMCRDCAGLDDDITAAVDL